MSGLEPLVLPAMIGSTALSTGGSLLSGFEKSSSAGFEAEQMATRQRQSLIYQQQLRGHRKQLESEQAAYEATAENTRTAADIAETARREDLTSNIETIQAIRAGRGTGTGTPTGRAILDELMRTSARDTRVERLNFMTQADAADRAAHNLEIDIFNNDLAIEKAKGDAELYGKASSAARRKSMTSLLAGGITAGSNLFGGITSIGKKYG